ncbi:MAG: hypothetical protein WCR02_06285 [Sphaerochaetaceae bacterium]
MLLRDLSPNSVAGRTVQIKSLPLGLDGPPPGNGALLLQPLQVDVLGGGAGPWRNCLCGILHVAVPATGAYALFVILPKMPLYQKHLSA